MNKLLESRLGQRWRSLRGHSYPKFNFRKKITKIRGNKRLSKYFQEVLVILGFSLLMLVILLVEILESVFLKTK